MHAATSDTPPGERHASLTKLATHALRERILAGEFAAGDRLVEGRLSEQLGVSRIPVREALRALAAEGLVRIEPRRGASVAEFSAAHVRDMVEVRATLEGLNAKLAARRHDPAQIAELERILAEGTRLAEETDAARIAAQNTAFHDALGRIAANTVLQDLMRSLRDRTDVVFTPRNRGRGRQNWQEHADILRAVIAGDAELAALLAARHVYSAAQLDTPPPA